MSEAALTPTEAEVLELVLDGLSDQEIADRRFNSVRTVQSHVSSLLRKFGCKNRSQLIAKVTKARGREAATGHQDPVDVPDAVRSSLELAYELLRLSNIELKLSQDPSPEPSDLEDQPRRQDSELDVSDGTTPDVRGRMLRSPVRMALPFVPPEAVRRAELDEVRRRLAERQRRIAIHGDAGVGKSTLAAMYALQWEDAYDVVAWINADHSDAMRSDLDALADVLRRKRIAPIAGRSRDERIEALRRWLEEQTDWLLVVDNVHHRRDIEWALPAGSGHVIITSQFGHWYGCADSLPLTVFSPDEAVELLVRASGDGDREAALHVAELREFSVLELAETAAYLARGAGRTTLREHASSLADDRAARLPDASARRIASVERRLALCESEIPGTEATAELLAALGGNAVPLAVLASAGEATLAHLEALAQHTIGKFAAGHFTVHRTIQDAVRNVARTRFSDGTAWRSAAQLLSRFFPTELDSPETASLRAEILPNAVRVLEEAESLHLTGHSLASLASGVGVLLKEQGDPDRALEYQYRAQRLLPDDESQASALRADILNNIGRCYTSFLNRVSDDDDVVADFEARATEAFEAAIALDRERGDLSDGRVYYRMHNLALRKPAPEKEELERAVIEGLERLRGENFVELHIPLDTLANTLRRLAAEATAIGEHGRAAELLTEAMEVAIRADHLAAQGDALAERRLEPLSTLARLHEDARRHEAALECHDQRSEISRRVDPDGERGTLSTAHRDRGWFIARWPLTLKNYLQTGIRDLEVAAGSAQLGLLRFRDLLVLSDLQRAHGDLEPARESAIAARNVARSGQLGDAAEVGADGKEFDVLFAMKSPDAEAIGVRLLDRLREMGDPSVPTVLWQLGRLAEEGGDHSGAYERFVAAREVAAEDAPHLGVACFVSALRSGEAVAATEEFRRLVNEGAPSGDVGLALCAAIDGNRVNALEIADAAQTSLSTISASEAGPHVLLLRALFDIVRNNADAARGPALEVARLREVDRATGFAVLRVLVELSSAIEPSDPEGSAMCLRLAVDHPTFATAALDQQYGVLLSSLEAAYNVHDQEWWDALARRRDALLKELLEGGGGEQLLATLHQQVNSGRLDDAQPLLRRLVEMSASEGLWDIVRRALFLVAGAAEQNGRPDIAAAALSDLPDGLRVAEPSAYGTLTLARASARSRGDEGDPVTSTADLATVESIGVETGDNRLLALLSIHRAELSRHKSDWAAVMQNCTTSIHHAHLAADRTLESGLRRWYANAIADVRPDVAMTQLETAATLLAEHDPAAVVFICFDQAALAEDDDSALHRLTSAYDFATLVPKPRGRVLTSLIDDRVGDLIAESDPRGALEAHLRSGALSREFGSAGDWLVSAVKAIALLDTADAPGDVRRTAVSDWCDAILQAPLPNVDEALRSSAHVLCRTQYPGLERSIGTVLDRVSDQHDPRLTVDLLMAAVALAEQAGWDEQVEAWTIRLRRARRRLLRDDRTSLAADDEAN